MRPTTQPVTVGDVVAGKYRVERRLGEGGMASVFAATHLELGGLVALKVLAAADDDPHRAESVARFSREARVMFALKGEHVARVFDVGVLPSGAPYLVMEYLEGRDLEAIANDGLLPVERAVDYVVQACLAVREAHELGTLHRDLKPSNLFLARVKDGREIVKVIDFGISKAVDPASEDVALTSTRSMVGTPRYMAPERFQAGAEPSPSADIWGLGAVLYRLLTGRPPYDAPTAFSLHAKILTEDPIPPDVLRPEIPRAISAIALRCLRRDPAQRFASVAALLAALEGKSDAAELATTRSEQAVPPESPSAPPHARRSLARPLVVLAAIVSVGSVAVLLARPKTSSRARPVASVSLSSPTPAAATLPAAALHVRSPRRVTFGDGCEELPAFTHDGQSLVYDVTIAGKSSIVVMDVANGASRAITTVDSGWDYGARPSPDGSQVAFLRSAGGRTSAYLTDLRGGPAKRFAEGNGRPSWSLDGRSIWAGDRAHVVRYDAATGEPRETLATPVGFQAARSLELPGGDLAVLFPFYDGTAGGGVGVFDAARTFRWLLQADVGVELAATPDGRHLLVPRKLVTGGYEVLDVPVAGSPADAGPTSVGASEVTPDWGLDVSSDGKRIAWSTCSGEDELAAVDGKGALAPVRVGGDRHEQDVAWVPGTELLVVVSARGGPLRPWIIDQSGHLAPAEVALDGPEVNAIAVSPDGKWLAVEARPEGIRVASLADRAGVRTITSGRSDSWPSFRRGSTEVLFTRTNDDGTVDVRAVSVAGGDARVIVPAPARRAVASPVDDRVLFLAGADVQQQTPMLADGHGGAPSRLSPSLPPARYGALQFSADGKKVAIVRAGRELFEIDVATGAVLRTVHDEQMTRVAYTKDRLVVVRRVWRGDLWLADLGP